MQDGNPNGDPDSGNLPRTDPETGHGLVTDVCLKRKIRNYVDMKSAEVQDAARRAELGIFVRENAVLNDEINAAVQEVTGKNAPTKNATDRNDARALMCGRFYDIRTFGGVLSTGNNAGQVRGAVQLTFSRSIDPVFPLEHTITRMAATDAKEQKQNEQADDGGGNRTMGRKATVSYGLYRAHGFITPHYAQDTGFTEADLELFWEAVQNMFEVDHSASRGLMALRKLIVFKHESRLGNAPAHKLFDRVKVQRDDAVEVARSYEDYHVTIDTEAMPQCVELQELV